MLDKITSKLGSLGSFGKKASTLLGVDISTTSIKILQLSPHGDKFKVDNYVIRPLPFKCCG